MTVVAVDAMGGDRGPSAAVEGAIAAVGAGVEVALVGDTRVLQRELARIGSTPPGVRLVHAPDAIEMGDHAAREARTRRGSSIYIGVQLVQQREAAAFVSAGNTGAVFAIALLTLGRLAGIERPALGAVLPLPAGPTLLLDVGANAEVRSSHLVQFAHLGVAYMRAVGGVPAPTVGLLNIGEEPTKGTHEAIEAHAALATSGLRFVGNVEGRDVFSHRADVVVTDGFTGNAILKTAEGVIDVLFTELRRAATSSLRARAGALLMRPSIRAIADRTDYRRYGAVPLLGVDGAVFVAHGRSDPRAITSAILTAARAAERGMRDALAASVGSVQEQPVDRGVTKLENRGQAQG
jgi:glycerol-3-phosphate acyltransferase PlsX